MHNTYTHTLTYYIYYVYYDIIYWYYIQDMMSIASKGCVYLRSEKQRLAMVFVDHPFQC